MTTTVEELIVAMEADGMEDTANQVNQVDDEFEETAGSIDETGDEMEGFSKEFEGAMTAILAGLAVAATGLLSQVPVIGEAFAGLKAILSAVAFQMDQVLRPVITPITDVLFDLADAIYEADGAMGDVIGVIGTIAAVLGLVGGTVLSVIQLFYGFSGVLTALKVAGSALLSPFKFLGSAITGLVSGTTLLAGALGVLLGLFGVGILETTGFLDAVQDLGDTIGQRMPSALKDFSVALIGAFLGPFTILGAAIRGFVQGFLNDGLVGGLNGAVQGVQDALSVFRNAFEGVFNDIIQAALQWGEDIMSNLAQGIRDKTPDVVEDAKQAADAIMIPLSFDVRENDLMAQEWGSDMLEHFSKGMQDQVSDVPTELMEPEGDSQTTTRQPRRTQLFVDGRAVEKSTRSNRDNLSNRLGRFG